MQIDLAEREQQAVSEMAREMGVSEQAVMRQALRHYQLLRSRLADGETFSFSGDQARLDKFTGGIVQ